MRTLEKYSIGIGDRFGRQGRAQLQALAAAKEAGVTVVPVWNKSFREHSIIHTEPADVRREADAAVRALRWKDSYYVDADHINLKNVDAFIEASDFFTLDVADYIGRRAEAADLRRFAERCGAYSGKLSIPGVDRPFAVTPQDIESIGARYLWAVQEAGRIYRHILAAKGEGTFVAEVSMDETKEPQTPVELFFILAAIAEQGIPAQTIAPKFSGRFNKGVDYVGDVARFEREFREDLLVIAFAIDRFDLPRNLKLSVHSGSDKFSIYGSMRSAIREFNAGLHLKTAGTTWLEELTGLAAAGGDGLRLAQQVYRAAYGRFDELCGPYATVIDIDRARLPSPDAVDGWSSETYAAALSHDPSCPEFNAHFRQLLHVGYKVAAEMGKRYLDALEEFESTIAGNVTANIYERHLRPLFVGP